jgi:purine-binding chemotaxis protein CheW
MPARPETRPDAGRLVVFRVAGRDFALPLRPVVEIIRHRPPTPVPWADKAVEGILPLRGRMVTLLDTRLRLGLGQRPPGGGPRVIVVDAGEEGLVGLVVDEVQGVAPAAVPEPPPAALRLDGAGLCRGVVSGRDRAILVLDLAALLGGGS